LQDTHTKLKHNIAAALFAASIAIGAYIALPIGPVPIVLQNFFIMCAAMMLGYKTGTMAIALYLLAGLIGLPVFSGGGGGPAHLMGPTGGYLISYLPAGFLMAFIAEKTKRSLWGLSLAALTGIIIIYLIGVPWLKISLGMDWAKAASAGMIPFIPGDIIKAAAAVGITAVMKNRVEEFLG